MARFLLAALFIGLPIAEIYTFITVSDAIGGLATVGLVLASVVCGMGLIRWQGVTMVEQARQSLAQGEPPVKSLVNGAAIFVAGLLLMIPGFLSDGLALLLLIPPVRWLIMAAMVRHFGSRMSTSVPPGDFGTGFGTDFDSGFKGGFGGGVDIEGEYRDISPQATSPSTAKESAEILPPLPANDDHKHPG